MKDLSEYGRMTINSALRDFLINSPKRGKSSIFIWEEYDDAREFRKKIEYARRSLYLSEVMTSSDGTSMGKLSSTVKDEAGLFHCFILDNYQKRMISHYISITLIDCDGKAHEWSGSLIDLCNEITLYLHVMMGSPEFEEIEN